MFNLLNRATLVLVLAMLALGCENSFVIHTKNATPFPANVLRTDINSAQGITGDYGFQIPAQSVTKLISGVHSPGSTQIFYVYAVDGSITENYTLLNSSGLLYTY